MKRVQLLTIVAVSLSAILSFPPRAHALDAWALTPTPTFTGTIVDYSYNSANGANTVSHRSTGEYWVTMEDVYPSYGGNVQVVSFGADNIRCQVDFWWRVSDNLVIGVRCHQPDGTAANSRFVAWYVRGDSITPELAYAWASCPTCASYSPSATYQYNSNTGSITITRSSVGRYTVRVPNFMNTNSTAHVTAYGEAGQQCQVGGWSPLGSDVLVRVNCYNASGSASDEYFTFRFNHRADGASPIGFAWASDPTSSSYPVPAHYQYNLSGANNTAFNFAPVGESAVLYPNLPPVLPSTAMVTSYGDGARYCKLMGWGGDPVQVDVKCFASSGTPVFTRYTQSYQALTTCLVPSFAPGVVGGGGTPGCVVDDLLDYSDGCYLECDTDYWSPGGAGIGGYECRYGERIYYDPGCVVHTEWEVDAWGICGENNPNWRGRTVRCVTVDTRTVVADSLCDAGTRPREMEPCGGSYCALSTASGYHAGGVSLCLYEYSGGPKIGCIPSYCDGDTLHQWSCYWDPGIGGMIIDGTIPLYCGSAHPGPPPATCGPVTADDGEPGNSCNW